MNQGKQCKGMEKTSPQYHFLQSEALNIIDKSIHNSTVETREKKKIRLQHREVCVGDWVRQRERERHERKFKQFFF